MLRSLFSNRISCGFRTLEQAIVAKELQGENQLPKVIQGVKFREGIEVSMPTSQSAA
jgi:hypothetical protein